MPGCFQNISIQLLNQMRMSEQGKLPKPAISTKCSLVVLVIAFSFLMLVTIMNALMYQGLFIRSVNWIYQYQQAQPQEAIQFIHKFFSVFYGPIGVGITLGIYLVLTKRKLRTLAHILLFFEVTYVMALMKQALQETRPIWFDARIHQWDWFCPVDAGNPSGHTMAVILLNQPILSDTIGFQKYKILALPLAILAIVLTISRMYLGAHSADQVLIGLVLGFVGLILFKFVFQEGIFKLLWALLTGKKQLKVLRISLIIALNLLTLGLPVIVYYINAENQPWTEKQITMINQVCKADVNNEQAQTAIFKSSGIGSAVFGILFGFMFLKNKKEHRKYFMGLWDFKSKRKFLVNLGVYALCGGIPFGLMLLFDHVAEAPLLQYFLLCLVIEMASFNLTFFHPLLCTKFNVFDYKPLPTTDSTHEENDEAEHINNKRGQLISHHHH